MKNNKKQSVRLPKWFAPERYELELEPAIEEATFRSSEILHYALAKPSKEITLHAAELSISDVKAVATGKTFEAKKTTFNKKNETVTFVFDKTLPKGKGRLYLSFEGILNDRMHGFYRSSYQHEGREHFLATTQFEAVDARRAFPCVDEPAAKAVFEVTIIAPEHKTVISNTVEKAIVKHETKPGYKAVTFVPTPKMSTYLLAFLVGDFESIEGKTKNGVTVRIFATPGKKNQLAFALDTAKKCLEFYNNYFGIPYPLPILDLIAVPDFAMGAMENWGAITYRETALLYDEEHSSLGNKQRVAIVIAHELAHQWFGNLVTMEWWTDLWLNEGFASYMEYLAVDHVFPMWDIWTQFLNDDFNRAMELDALYHTHPIEVEVRHPAEIDEIFDAVSYSKGASVIRMLAEYIGEKDFREGLRMYLKKHAHGNTVTEDLWKAFEKASGKPVSAFMKQWTAEGGFPVVKVHEKGDVLTFEQSRFFMSPLSKAKAKSKTLWKVPIAIETSERKKQALLLDKKKGSIKIPRKTGGWVTINPNQTGFYMVDYSPSLLMDLRTAIAEKKLSTVDRLALIRDAFALAEAGESKTTDALNLLTAYESEDEYAVWVEIVGALGTLKKLLYGRKTYPLLETYAQHILGKIVKKVGWVPKKDEAHTHVFLRSMVLGAMASFNHEPTIKKALQLYKSKRIPNDLKGLVYSVVAKQGGAKEHAEFIRMYKAAHSQQQEQSRIAQALGAFQDKVLLQKTLDFAFSKDVRPQDTLSPYYSVWRNPRGKEIAWKGFKKYWKDIIRRYTVTSKMIGYFIDPVGAFTTEKDARAVAVFFKGTELPKNNRALMQALEHIRANAEWIARERKAVEAWLKEEAGN
jgi:puromycin-sensitive aminopeptidase